MGFFKKQDNETPPNMSAEQINKEFMRHYAPYTLPDFKPSVRSEDELPTFDEPDGDKLRILVREVDLRREKDPYVGIKLAGREIYANLIETLKSDKGVHIESMLAVIGAVGGYECMGGIMSALNAVIDSGVPLATAGAMSIFIAETKSGEKLLLGDRVGNEFCTFCMNAAKITEPPFEALKPLSVRAAQTGGTPEYWETPFNETVGGSPKEFSEAFKGRFEATLNTFCRYPQERMLAWSVAAQITVEKAREVISPNGLDKAMSIISEFGWRTSHYIC